MPHHYARLIAVAILITACSASISAQPEAVAELRAAADQGHAPAQVNLGVLYENGRGVGRENFAEAVRWYQQAAQQGHCVVYRGVRTLWAEGIYGKT